MRSYDTLFENGFEKSKHLTTYWLKHFSSDTPKSIKRQNMGPKEHDEKYIPSTLFSNQCFLQNLLSFTFCKMQNIARFS